jgi:hypothetical protein
MDVAVGATSAATPASPAITSSQQPTTTDAPACRTCRLSLKPQDKQETTEKYWKTCKKCRDRNSASTRKRTTPATPLNATDMGGVNKPPPRRRKKKAHHHYSPIATNTYCTRDGGGEGSGTFRIPVTDSVIRTVIPGSARITCVRSRPMPYVPINRNASDRRRERRSVFER